jgi:GNAT superfamily N-acetyltransferase
MEIEVREERFIGTPPYATIPIAFEVTHFLEVAEGGPDGFVLTRCPVAGPPYTKDYDALPGEGPRTWARSFDVSNWRQFTAWVDGELAGGAVVAFSTPGVHMLEDRVDLAVLWDIRVAPPFRRGGVGAALFRAVESWARSSGCRDLKVETQNINLPACRFYASQGCELRVVNPDAYRDLPHELQLLWYKDLTFPG